MLIKCPNCWKEKINIEVEKCPNCGFGIKNYFEKKAEESENKNRKYNSVLKICCVALIIIALASLIIYNYKKEKMIEQLREYAVSSFTNDFDTYLEKVSNSIDVTGAYRFSDEKYDSANHKLTLICYPSYKSEDISDYYTQEYDDTGRKLNSIMAKIKKSIDADNNYEYTLEGVGSISVFLIHSDDKLIIHDGDNNIYSYGNFMGMDRVEINEEWVYYEDDGNYVESKSAYNNLSNTANTTDNTTVTDDEELGVCWSLAIDVVKSQLKSPSSAKFPFSYADSSVSITKSANTYTVKAWVEAENSFGTTLRNNFTVTMEKSGSGKDTKFTSKSCVIQE